jgi:hypothetical protein
MTDTIVSMNWARACAGGVFLVLNRPGFVGGPAS